MERFTLDKLPGHILTKLDLDTVFMVSRLIIAAERLQVFRKLQGQRSRLGRLGELLSIHPRYLGYFLDALVALDLLQKEGDEYWNTSLAEKYFIEERSVYWTRQFSAECVEVYEAFTVLEKVLKTGQNYQSILGKKKQSYLEAMRKNPQQASDFTRMLYFYHQEEAETLADYLDLTLSTAVLDVAGGSGVMSMYLVRKNPHLRACVLDIEPVCEVAQQLIQEQGLSHRITTYTGDMYEKLPSGYDVIMFCDIGVLSKKLLRMAYTSLPDNGLLVLVDRFMSEDRTEPLSTLLYQFMGAGFPVSTRQEMVDLVATAGFTNVTKYNLHQDTWVVTGQKI